jgi:hypothetical protein
LQMRHCCENSFLEQLFHDHRPFDASLNGTAMALTPVPCIILHCESASNAGN